MASNIEIASDLELDPMTVEEVNNFVNKIVSNKIQYKEEVSSTELQEQANLFLSAVQKLEKDTELFEENALKFIAFKADPASTNYQKDKLDAFQKSIMQQEYLLANNFEKYLDTFRKTLERSAIYVAVNNKGKIIGSYELPMKELIGYTDKLGNFLQGQINVSNRQSLESQNLFDEQHIIEAQMAYDGVYNRLERYYQIHNTDNDTKTSGLLLWKDSGKGWIVGRVLNYGDLKEAYIKYLFDDHGKKICTLAGGNPPYYRHSFIGEFFRKYINEVTNMPAVIEEDVKVKSLNKQYAVKGSGSHLPSLQQYIDIAQSISYAMGPKYITRKSIENKLKEQNPADAKRNIELGIKELTQEELNTLRKEFNKSQKLTS